MQKVNIDEKFELFNDYWSPRIVAELNGQHLKLAKLKGEFIWHLHELEDEMFFVVKGELVIELPEKPILLKENEFLVIPRGIEHRPIANEEVWIMLFEPNTTLNTGNAESDFKKEFLEYI